MMVCTKCGEKLKEYEENNKSFEISLNSKHAKFNVPVVFKENTVLCDQCCKDFFDGIYDFTVFKVNRLNLEIQKKHFS